MNFKYIKIAIIGVALTLITNSCSKDQPACHGNCANLTISGRTYIKSTGKAIVGVPVDVRWFTKVNCIGCTTYKVASGKTDSNGNFSFNTTIDSTFFKDYRLRVRVSPDSDYINLPRVGSDAIEERLDTYDALALQNLKFEYYPKTFMTITLHRALTDSFNFFTVDHELATEFRYADFSTGPGYTQDTSYTVATAADIYTKLIWTKKIINGSTSEQTDSLICTKGGANTFLINY